VRDGSKGRESVYTNWKGFEIMFHVSTLLPYHPLDPQKVYLLHAHILLLCYMLCFFFFFVVLQSSHALTPGVQLARSRVIGNDITTIVFQEGLTPVPADLISGDVHRIASHYHHSLLSRPLFSASAALTVQT
jgi:hypothetical protein